MKIEPEIADLTNQFILTCDRLTSEELSYSLNPNVWSVAQNLEHIIVINETYFPIFDSLIENNYKEPIFSNIKFIVRFFGRFILKSVNKNRKKRIKTFKIWEPNNEFHSTEILEKFIKHQEVLSNYFIKLIQLEKLGTVISSPASNIINYTIEDAFKIIIEHEKRHLEQIKEILSHE